MGGAVIVVVMVMGDVGLVPVVVVVVPVGVVVVGVADDAVCAIVPVPGVPSPAGLATGFGVRTTSWLERNWLRVVTGPQISIGRRTSS